MKKFEYKIVTAERKNKFSTEVDIVASEAILTGDGLTGWEAVGTFVNTSQVCFLMKRELPQE